MHLKSTVLKIPLGSSSATESPLVSLSFVRFFLLTSELSFPDTLVLPSFSQMCFICSVTLHILLKRENARRDALYGPPPPAPPLGETYSDEVLQRLGLYGKTEEEIVDMGDFVPTFRYIL